MKFLPFFLLSALSLSAANVTLQWDASPDSSMLASYRVNYGTASATKTNVLVVPATNLTATISNLSAGVTYYVTVAAVATNGLASDPSNEVQFTVPRPPVQLRIQVSLQSSSDLEHWTEITNVSLIVDATEPNSFFRASMIATR